MATALPTVDDVAARRVPLLLVVGFALTVAWVGPWREFASQDDGWAYARSVRWLLEDGTYRLDAWSAANNPVQVLFAAGLAKMFGFSWGVLRLSTLLLLATGLAAFNGLLREFVVPADKAALLTLVLLANPLVLMLAFTFMSDIHFMAWMTIALWLYVRGMRLARLRYALLGSLAAGCAIGTRQFGMALLPALLLAWAAAPNGWRPPLRFMFVALLVPLVVAAWQLRAGLQEPNVTQLVRLQTQEVYQHLHRRVLMKEVLWRPATAWRYVGMMLLAAAPLLLAPARRAWRDGPAARLALVPVFGYLVALRLAFSSVSTRDTGDLYMPLWWMLPGAWWQDQWLLWTLDAAGLVVAGTLAWVLVVGGFRHARRWTPAALLVAGTALALLALHVAYVQFNDTYIVGLLPFGLLGLGLCLRGLTMSPRTRGTVAVLALGIMGAQAAWLRGDYNMQQAQWVAAERLKAEGVPLACIGGSRHWSEYNGAFDAWLAEARPSQWGIRAERLAEDALHDPFYAWLSMRSYRAAFQVSSVLQPEPPAGWATVREVPYRDALLRQRTVKVFAPAGASRPLEPACAKGPR